MENLVTMYQSLTDIYKEKKIFLTGHTGFKGSWLLKTFNLLGANVFGYALPPPDEPNLYTCINGGSLCTSVYGDLRDKDLLYKSILDFQPDFIFHLAAQPLVRVSYQIPSETFEVNAIGTANVLDGMKLLQKTCYAVLITTDKVYHNYEWEYPYREVDRLGGYDPYSASKACAELVIESYKNSFFNIKNFNDHKKAIAVARAGNVIGGGDWAKDRLVPDIIRALSRGNEIEIRNPDAIRPWQHVIEPLTGYLMLGAKLSENPRMFSQAYNFGPNLADALPVREMVKLSVKSWGDGSFHINQSQQQPHEAGMLKLDINKAITQLNWYPKMNAAEAVSATILWYKNYYKSNDDINAVTKTQIMDYLNLK